jgi:Family of unknown function (DUF5677)
MARIRKNLTIYKTLSPFIAEVGQATMDDPDFFEICLKAALIKNFDFNFYVSQKASESHPFYLTPTLRGMCEDIIFLKPLLTFSKKDRSKVIQHIQVLDSYESLKSQKEFFNQNRPWQPVLGSTSLDTEIQKEENKLLQTYQRLGLVKGKQKRPSVRQMAEIADLLPLYNFLYAATSKWVHFSPHILMRMGWSSDKDKESGNYTFSSKHFSKYYTKFNRTYGTYLFILFYDTFAKQINIDHKAEKYVAELKNSIDIDMIWAEVITFEEMNIKRPPAELYLLARAKYENPDEDEAELIKEIRDLMKESE